MYLPLVQVSLRWDEFTMSTPSKCDDSYIEVYDRTTALADLKKQYCGNMAKYSQSTSNHVYMRVFALNTEFLPKFTTLFTIYTMGMYD